MANSNEYKGQVSTKCCPNQKNTNFTPPMNKNPFVQSLFLGQSLCKKRTNTHLVF